MNPIPNLFSPQEDIQFKGHSIECRINAEDPFANFRPGPGRVSTYLAPGGPHVRMDSHLYTDYLVPPNYDSLLGKLIVWGEDRNQAIVRMLRALDETVILGVPTTGGRNGVVTPHQVDSGGDAASSGTLLCDLWKPGVLECFVSVPQPRVRARL